MWPDLEVRWSFTPIGFSALLIIHHLLIFNRNLSLEAVPEEIFNSSSRLAGRGSRIFKKSYPETLKFWRIHVITIKSHFWNITSSFHLYKAYWTTYFLFQYLYWNFDELFCSIFRWAAKKTNEIISFWKIPDMIFLWPSQVFFVCLIL